MEEFNYCKAKELNESIREIEKSQYVDRLLNSSTGKKDYRLEYDELSNRAVVRLVDISNSIEEAIEDIENGKIKTSEVRKSLSDSLSKIENLIDLAMYGIMRA